MRRFHLTFGGKRFAVSVERTEEAGRFQVVVDGVAHEVEVEEEEPTAGSVPGRAALPPRPAVAPRPVTGSGVVISPLPGVILSIEVQTGQAVEPGDRLMVLEAMKMENAISAETNGTVRAIRVKKGEKVEAGQELMVIE